MSQCPHTKSLKMRLLLHKSVSVSTPLAASDKPSMKENHHANSPESSLTVISAHDSESDFMIRTPFSPLTTLCPAPAHPDQQQVWHIQGSRVWYPPSTAVEPGKERVSHPFVHQDQMGGSRRACRCQIAGGEIMELRGGTN